MLFDNFFFNYSSSSKIFIFKINSYLSFAKSYFYVFCRLNQNNFQLFSLYYFLACILGLSIRCIALSIKSFSLKKLSFIIIYSKISIISILLKFLYGYLPLLDSLKLKINVLKPLYTGNIRTFSIKLNFFEFPLLYDLDIFYDLGFELIDNNFLKCSTSIFFKTYHFLNTNLILFFFFSFFKLPLYHLK